MKISASSKQAIVGPRGGEQSRSTLAISDEVRVISSWRPRFALAPFNRQLEHQRAVCRSVHTTTTL